MTRKIITITGELGSGKSTVSKHLAVMLGAQRYSTGDVQRQIAQSRGISTLELNILAEKDPSIDKEIDSVFANIRELEGNLVIDSRLAWHFIPESIKIRLVVCPEEAAKRVHRDDSRVSESSEMVEETRAGLAARRESEHKHFMTNYGVDIGNDANFDFVIDTSSVDPKEVALLISRLAQDKTGGAENKYWVSPKNIFPTKHVPALIQEKEFDCHNPVAVIKVNSDYFVHDGHQRISGALNANLPLIPVVFIDAPVAINLSWIHDWESLHGFYFRHYPKPA